MSIRIIKLRCPQGHSIAAMAYESLLGGSVPEVMKNFKRGVQTLQSKGELKGSCHLCGKRLGYEDRPGTFETLDEAISELSREHPRKLTVAPQFERRIQ